MKFKNLNIQTTCYFCKFLFKLLIELRLISNLKADVVILGGGISGALMAHQLVKNGIDCIVVDSRDIGLGSTCASTALLQYEIDIPLHQLANIIGKQNAITAYKTCADCIDKIENIAKEISYAGFVSCDSLYFTHKALKDNYITTEFAIRKEAGFDVNLLSRHQIKKRFCFSSSSAILSSKAGKIDAFAFTHALHAFNAKKGLKVYHNTNVSHIKHTDTSVELTTEKGYKIKAKKIIYATGYEVMDIIEKPIVQLHSTYAIITKPVNALPNCFVNTLLWNTDDPYLYMREDSGRLIIGGRDEDYTSPERREKALKRKATYLLKDFKKLFPEIEAEIAFAWTGTFGTTKDGLPYIGNYPKMPNAYFALGFGGNGITFSALAADLNTELILNKKNTIPAIYSFNR